MYQALYRKWRPRSFDDVVSQSHVTTTLKNQIITGKTAHAYLFTGSRGTGKTTCAKILAKALNCNDLKDGNPCLECESCKNIDNEFSDVTEIDAASNNGVDYVRDLKEDAVYAPMAGKYKVYIIDEVHMLSSAAFNALLKTLEEPPEYAKFILATTEKNKIIPTILSRCQVFDFKRITMQDIVGHLEYVAKSEGVDCETGALEVIARHAEGGMRDALSTFDQLVTFTGGKLTREECLKNLNVLDTTYYQRLVSYFTQGDISSSLLLYKEVLDRGFDGQQFITGLAEYLRNLLVALDPATRGLLSVAESESDAVVQQAAACGVRLLLQWLGIASDYEYRYRESNSKRLFTEVCLMKLCAVKMAQPSGES